MGLQVVQIGIAYMVSNMLGWVRFFPAVFFGCPSVDRSLAMPAATLTAKGQIVIPAEIRARHQLTPGTRVEFVDEGGVIRLLVRRRVTASDPVAGYGMIRIERSAAGPVVRRLANFDAAALLKRPKTPVPKRPKSHA